VSQPGPAVAPLHDVFVSYSHADEALAADFVAFLTSHQLTVHWDQQFDYGGQVSKQIDEGIRGARVVVVLVSKSSASRDWVEAEVWSARKVIPVVIDDIGADSIHFKLRPLVQANIMGWDRASATPALKKLVAQLLAGRTMAPALAPLLPVATPVAVAVPMPSATPAVAQVVTTTEPPPKSLPIVLVSVLGGALAVAATMVALKAIKDNTVRRQGDVKTSAGVTFLKTQAPLPAPRAGVCAFEGSAESVRVVGPSSGLLTKQEAFSAPYAQEVRMPFARVARYVGNAVYRERGPGIVAKLPSALTPVNADDKPFDVNYLVRGATAQAAASILVEIKAGGASGELSGADLMANGESIGNERWDVEAVRPFSIEVSLTPTKNWPGGRGPIVAGPFDKASAVQLVGADGRLSCADAPAQQLTLSWGDVDGRVFVDELRVEHGRLQVSLRSPSAPSALSR
jgi:hypothetical protein